MKGQRGLSLVELVVAVAVTGIIVVFLGTAIYQMITITGYGNSRLTALHELQNAAHWFTRDGQRAVSADASGGLLLTISESLSITYSLAGTELRRDPGGNPMVLARNISSAAFSVDSRTVTMSLTSSPGGRDAVSENATYRVFLRPTEGG